MAYRCSSAAAATGALMRRVFAARGIPLGDRTHVAQACVVSRLLHGAGTWLALSAAQLRKVQGQYMRPLRRIAGHDAPPAEGGRWPTALETLVATGQAPVQAHIAAARLRLAARISLRGTPAIQGLAQSWTGAGWRKALVRDMRLMHMVLRKRLWELPDPAAAPAIWDELWRKHPGAWAGLVRKMVQQAAEQPAAFLAALAECGEVAEEGESAHAAEEIGEQHPQEAAAGPPDELPHPAGAVEAAAPAPHAAEAEAPAEPALAPAGGDEAHVFACTDCGKRFATKRGLMCHGPHAHARQRPSARFVVTSVCLACGNDYRTRVRAMEHVERGSVRCRIAVVEGGMGLAPHEPAVVAAADEADRVLRRQARSAGVSELAGPPARLHRGAQ